MHWEKGRETPLRLLVHHRATQHSRGEFTSGPEGILMNIKGTCILHKKKMRAKIQTSGAHRNQSCNDPELVHLLLGRNVPSCLISALKYPKYTQHSLLNIEHLFCNVKVNNLTEASCVLMCFQFCKMRLSAISDQLPSQKSPELKLKDTKWWPCLQQRYVEQMSKVRICLSVPFTG